MTEITVDHVKDVWEAFSTLSDAQEMVENKEWERANDLINHSKLHLMRMMGTVPALRREAMSAITTVCQLNDLDDLPELKASTNR